MAKKQINIRGSALTHRQLEKLMEWWGTSQTETLTVVIDRAYQAELEKQERAEYDRVLHPES